MDPQEIKAYFVTILKQRTLTARKQTAELGTGFFCRSISEGDYFGKYNTELCPWRTHLVSITLQYSSSIYSTKGSQSVVRITRNTVLEFDVIIKKHKLCSGGKVYSDHQVNIRIRDIGHENGRRREVVLDPGQWQIFYINGAVIYGVTGGQPDFCSLFQLAS